VEEKMDDSQRPADEAIEGQNPAAGQTEDERLLQSAVDLREERGLYRLSKDSWRVFRIMGEFVEGFDELSALGPAISIFGSARVSEDDPMYAKCVETARLIGEAGFTVITGGGPGIMEAANRGAREAGAPSVGCNIELPFEQGTNAYVDMAIDFRYFFVRKTMFMKYAEAFVIFHGGFGTLDELFESLTLIQTRKVWNFPVVMFGTDYWGGLIEWIRDRLVAEGKISPEDMDLFLCTDSPEEVVEHIVQRFEEFQDLLTDPRDPRRRQRVRGDEAASP
jgi:uncharacterized protein (TIGR00730 family)